jgi:membrane-anchored protein YejM (alkaline phosphatase superfamily)
LFLGSSNLYLFMTAVLCVITAVALAEPAMPTMLSRLAPPSSRGTAAGLYHSFEFVGSFVGGLLGGLFLERPSDLGGILLILAIGLTSLVLTEYFLAKGTIRYSPLTTRWLWLVALAIMLSGQLFYAYSDARANRQVTSMLRYVPWALPLTAKRNLRKFGVEVVKSQPAGYIDRAKSSLNYPKTALSCSGAENRPPNILMLVVDSLRFDMLSEEVMPNSVQLSSSSWVFNNHYSTGNATRFGMFGLLYGLPGSYWFPMVAEQKGSLLIDGLQQRNYQLFLLASASWSSPEFDRTVFSSVSDQLEDHRVLKNSGNSNRHRDSIVASRMIERIRKRDQQRPFFGIAFFDAPHSYSRDSNADAPFLPELESVNYLALDEDYDPLKFFNRYKNSVHFNDNLIGGIISEINQQALMQETIIIITSDHGQEFNDSGQNYWGHNGNFSRYQAQVPLLIRWPGRPPNKVNHRSSHEDIVPTLLQEGLGCDTPIGDYSTGQNLFSETYQQDQLLIESWSRRALLIGEHTYVFESYGETLVHDQNYREISDQPIDPKAVIRSMDTMSEFLK